MSLRVDIEKRLGDFTLSVRFDAGAGVHGLLGASGCGKSLTLRCIAGVLRPDRGHIEADGVTLYDSAAGVDLPPRKRGVGLLFQHYALFPNMTLEQNLLAALRGRGRPRDRGAVREMLGRFRLDGLERLRPAQLSGGQQQRAALARILLTEPGVLLLDEPFSALDSDLRWKTELELLDVLDGFSGTAVLVTHSRDEVHRLCATVTALHEGRGEGTETVSELFDAPKTLPECLLSGCKNYSPALRRGDHTLYAADWGAALRVAGTPPEGLAYAAIRAHHIELAAGPGENTLDCTVTRALREPFGVILMARTPGGGLLRAEPEALPGREVRPGERVWLRLPPERVMGLRG